MKFAVFALVCLLPLVHSLTLTDTSFKPCDVSPGKIQQVTVEPCTAEPCAVSNGNSVDISTTFIATHNTNSDCYLKASFLFGGAWYEIFDEEACGGDVTCPLVNGNTYVLKKTLQVTDRMPAGLQQTRWKLICNAAADEIFCADISVQVQA